MVRSAKATLLITPKLWCALRLECHGALPTLENDICLFLGKYRVVSALFGKIERLTFTGTFDAFQHLVKSHSFKQICFPHRSEMGVLKSFLNNQIPHMKKPPEGGVIKLRVRTLLMADPTLSLIHI